MSFILNILFGFTQFVFCSDFFLISKGYRWDQPFPVTGFFGDEKKLGSFMCRLLPIVVGSYLLVSKKKFEKKIINILIFFIPLFSLVILTSERMALVYCTSTFLFIIFYGFKINKKIVIIFSLLTLLIPLSFYLLNFNKIKTNLLGTYEQVFPKGKLVFFSEQHQVFAITSIELFKKKPILGIGPNNFRRKCNEVSSDFIIEKYGFDASNIQNCSTHPHNIFFQLLSETGLIGIIYYIIFNILLFIETFKFLFKKNYNQISFFFLLPVIYYLNPVFPSGNFFNNWYMCFGILGLPFYLYLTKIKKSV
jgi:O-antigen ligase